MLIDVFMPRYDVSEFHETVVTAPRERVFDAIRTADLAANPIAKLLLFLRGMGRKTRTSLKFHEGFAVAAEDRPHEIVIGLEGPFWKPTCRPRGVTALHFHDPIAPDTARAAWNFATEDAGDGRTRLTTETRVACADDARKKFRAYWFFIGPFSALIRRMMLRAIRIAAES